MLGSHIRWHKRTFAVVIILREIWSGPEELSDAVTGFTTPASNGGCIRQSDLEFGFYSTFSGREEPKYGMIRTIGGCLASWAEAIKLLEETTNDCTGTTGSRINEGNSCGAAMRNRAVDIECQISAGCRLDGAGCCSGLVFE